MVNTLRALVLSLAVALSVWSQTFYGTIVGTVNDSSGSAMPQVNITLINQGTAERRTAKTDGAGA
ncbi:MAG: carboxypeptidase-like regulatory domain-containing protein, partial [Acidobacteria bacterium]|nr:carboxypeptidase-like regulatory domain-containing protein [Acidobacteriota bacterium]